MRASVAAAALEAGAALVNDVSGGLADEAMVRVVADAGSPYVVMHWRGHSVDMASRAVYADVVTEVVDELQATAGRPGARRCRPRPRRRRSGARASRRTPTTTGRCSRTSTTWAALGRPVLVGASRKGFLGQLLTAADGSPRPAGAREDATTAVSVLAAAAGAWAVRVHEARATRDAVEVVAAARGAHGGWAAP